MSENYLTVSQVNAYLERMLSRDYLLSSIHVVGELSNVKYSKGHVYFSVSDASSTLKAVMFKSYTENMKFSLEDGMAVIVFGSVSMYEKTGQLQLYAKSVEDLGAGEKEAALKERREKLRNEGLFDLKNKKPLPFYARHIGVITSPTGSVIEDILQVAKRRNPAVIITVLPILVQGESAAEEIVKAFAEVNITSFDLLILARGGGSKEDLSAFDTEEVARAVANSPLPVISAIGHETDLTLSDLAADLRAATPSEAAELAVRERKDLVAILQSIILRLEYLMEKKFLSHQEEIKQTLLSSSFSYVLWKVEEEKEKTASLFRNFGQAYEKKIMLSEYTLSHLLGRIDKSSPLSSLLRGFSYVTHGGDWMKSVEDLIPSAIVEIHMKDGVATATIETITSEEKEGNHNGK